MKTVLAIDPGRDKCGLAVVNNKGALMKEVAPRDGISERAAEISSKFSADVIIIGNGTGGGQLKNEIESLLERIPVKLVDETDTTLKARERFFQGNPPKGLRKLIPQGLLTPNQPYDDYVALILAENYLNSPLEY